MDKKGNSFLVIAAFLLGMVIGMFISPVNGFSIGCNNNITNDIKNRKDNENE